MREEKLDCKKKLSSMIHADRDKSGSAGNFVFIRWAAAGDVVPGTRLLFLLTFT